MKLLNKPKNKFICFAAALLSLCLINMPAFSSVPNSQLKSINEINDNTFQGLARKGLDSPQVNPAVLKAA